LSTYIGSKKTILGKAYGTKLMRINWGTHWEQKKNPKNPTPLAPPPPPKEKNMVY